MKQHEVIIENAMKFSSEMAKSYAEEISIKQNKDAEKMAEKLIKSIESKYEGNIKKAITMNRNCFYVDIKLPIFSRIKNDGVYDKVAEIVERYFNNLGFRASMIRGRKCDCTLDCICNNFGDKRGSIRLYWQ